MIDAFNVTFAEFIYERSGVTEKSKHRISKEIAQELNRMSKEIAQELKDQSGDSAYLYCVEKLSNGTAQPQLWRDVLYWLDEIKEPASAGSLTRGETNEGS